MSLSPAQLLSIISISSFVISRQNLSSQRSSNHLESLFALSLSANSAFNSPCLVNPEYVRLLLPIIAWILLKLSSGRCARYNLAWSGSRRNSLTHTFSSFNWADRRRKVNSSCFVGRPISSWRLKSRAISNLHWLTKLASGRVFSMYNCLISSSAGRCIPIRSLHLRKTRLSFS